MFSGKKRTLMVKAYFLITLTICIILFSRIFQSSEPSYHGKGLDYWLNELWEGDPKARIRAAEALRSMRPSAVPHLIKTLNHEKSAFQRKIESYATRYPLLSRFIAPARSEADLMAITALAEIGPSASNAIPVLLRVGHEESGFGLPTALAAVMRIRGEPITPLVRILEGGDDSRMYETMSKLTVFGTNAEAAVPALCRMLTSTNQGLVAEAAVTLGRIGCDGQICVPALMDAAHRGNLESRSLVWIFWAFGEFADDARPAVSLLKEHLQDPDPLMRIFVLTSLSRILPPKEAKTLVPDLIQNLTYDDDEVRAMVKHRLQEIDSVNKSDKK